MRKRLGTPRTSDPPATRSPLAPCYTPPSPPPSVVVDGDARTSD